MIIVTIPKVRTSDMKLCSCSRFAGEGRVINVTCDFVSGVAVRTGADVCSFVCSPVRTRSRAAAKA